MKKKIDICGIVLQQIKDYDNSLVFIFEAEWLFPG